MTPITFLKRKVDQNQPILESQNFDLKIAQVISCAHQLHAEENKVANDVGAFVRPTFSTGQWLLLGDIVALFVSFIWGGFLTHIFNNAIGGDPGVFLDYLSPGQFGIFSGLGIMALFWFDAHGHYRQRLPYWEKVGNILCVTLIGFVVGGFVQFAMKNNTSRLWLGLSWVSFAVFILIGRAFVRRVLNACGVWKIPAILVGDKDNGQAALRALKDEPELGYEIVRVVPAEILVDLGNHGSWRRFLRAMRADFIFLALECSELERFQRSIKSMTRERVPFSIMPPWAGLPMHSLSSHSFMMHDVMMLHDTNRLELFFPSLVKRCFDIFVSGSSLLALSPIFLFIAFMVRRDGGSAFFSQPRVGRGGKLFQCLKFRSMRSDAEEALKKYLDENPEAAFEWEKYQKLKEDPRITAFGHFIRRTSLDELPQLINVLRGDMSLVGPRPILPGQEIYYADDISYYEAVRPGITGPWQVSGRNRLTFCQRVALEAWYARNWMLWTDIVIILKTIPALLKKDTAF